MQADKQLGPLSNKQEKKLLKYIRKKLRTSCSATKASAVQRVTSGEYWKHTCFTYNKWQGLFAYEIIPHYQTYCTIVNGCMHRATSTKRIIILQNPMLKKILSCTALQRCVDRIGHKNINNQIQWSILRMELQNFQVQEYINIYTDSKLCCMIL